MPSRTGGGLFRPAAFFLAALVLVPLDVWGQKKSEREARPAVDPYTEGDPEALERAGYVSYGPFLFGDDHTTETVELELGGIPLLWLETEHFRIGSSLDTFDLSGERVEKKKLKEELERLKERLPKVKTKLRKLDPWLRLHLYAMRLEELYADFCEQFGLKDEDFPSTPTEAAAKPGMGKGPYLGLKQKFSVLLVQKKSSLARYTETFIGSRFDSSYRYWYPKEDCMFFGYAADNLRDYAVETALHFAVVFGVTQNLSNGFRGYTHEGPLWWKAGIARWFARPIDERILLYTVGSGSSMRTDEDEAKWEPKVRARVEHGEGAYTPTEVMLTWFDHDALKFSDHLTLWSRIDYLMQRDDKTAHDLLLGLYAPVPWTTKEPREEVLEAQFLAAFVNATGLEPAAFDEAWSAWVKKNYKKR